MTGRIRLDDDQLESLAQSIAAKHPCRFDDETARDIHYFHEVMQNGGREALDALFRFGRFINEFERTGARVTVTAIVLGVISLIVAGVWAKLKGG